jgi:hypothetical protein
VLVTFRITYWIMRWRFAGPVALVATLVLAVSCRMSSDPTSVVDRDTAWAAEVDPWVERFLSNVEQLGGLGAAPFLAPDVLVDVRTMAGHAVLYDGVDAAIGFFYEMQAFRGSTGERMGFGEVRYVDANGVVIPGAYDRSVHPGVSPLLPDPVVIELDVGPGGIERVGYLPATRTWRRFDQTHVLQPADDAERTATAWAAAWSADDQDLVTDLYDHDAVLEDDVGGVHVRGVQAIADRWALSRMTAWDVIEHHGAPAVYLRSPRYGPDSESLTVLALVRGDAGAGCPGEFAVSLELDTDGRIRHERRLRSVTDALRCVAHEWLPDGWWTERTIPAGGASVSEDLTKVTGQIGVGGTTVEIRNGTPVLTELVSWGLARFDLAGMRLPVIRSVTFTSYTDYCDDVTGRTIFLPDLDPVTGRPPGGDWDVVLCFESGDAFIDDYGTAPSPLTRFVVLHELAHVWIDQNLDPAVAEYFMARFELPTWDDRAFDWNQRGVEWAADFIAWGLMDAPMPLFELDVPPIEWRVHAFQLLTGRQPLRRVE